MGLNLDSDLILHLCNRASPAVLARLNGVIPSLPSCYCEENLRPVAPEDLFWIDTNQN